MLLCLLATIGAFFLLNRSTAAPQTPTPEADQIQAQAGQVDEAIRNAIEMQAQTEPIFLLYENEIENFKISADGQWATAWMTPIDPENGEPVPTEPGLVLAHKEDGAWAVFLPSDPRWVAALRTVPEDLIPADTKRIWLQQAALFAQAAPSAPIGGYRLPFPGGDTRRLTQSVGHDRYTPSGNAHFSFDFATAYPSTLFQVVAARSGVVSKVRWTQRNGDASEPGNYIVLQDNSTNPVTYQLYLHLAQDSIPPELRIVGTPVRRGQYLGMADDTGISSGHHLHFMVHTEPSSYWGRSIDITFEDVAINGGRPRIQTDLSSCDSSDVCSSTQTDYRSQNYLNPDPTPPIGNITAPAMGALIPAGVMRIQGWALDESSGLYSVQILANYDNTWREISNEFTTSSFTYDWDICAAGVPDGPVSLALAITDKAFNRAPGLPGLTHVQKNFSCPAAPPACNPTASQVALFGDKDFAGECIVLGSGSYSTAASLGALGEDQAVSIRVGANVKATLFINTGLNGRSETFIADDSNLGDNRIGKKTVSSVQVQTRTSTPNTPAQIWPAAGQTFTPDASISLSWNNTTGATEFKARLLRGTAEIAVTGWQAQPYWNLTGGIPDGLAAGSYTWQVKSRIGTTESAWSAARAFSIQSTGGLPGGPALSAPIEDGLDSAGSWVSSGGWSLSSASNHTPGGSKSWLYSPAGATYDTGAANAGYLTSPPISIPAAGEYFLRFWYQYQTESSEIHWDQRRVQISTDGGPFLDVLQLSDDPSNFWLQSPAISLANYANHTLRVRFYFVTLDAHLNNFAGWVIDDFSVSATPPPTCSDSDNNPELAIPLALGAQVDGMICPAGDIDYYRFAGLAGDTIGAWIEAGSLGSTLDSYLTLLDSDGRSTLVKNDDMVNAVRTDSWVTYTLPRSGNYYLKVHSWEHPSVGELEMTYRLHLVNDSLDPAAQFISPEANGRLSSGLVELNVFATDGQSGISRVKFKWHPSDWLGGQWVTLGEDWDGSDGWTFSFDTTNVKGLSGSALYAEAFDWAGNSIGTGVWRLSTGSTGIYLPLVVRQQ